MTRIPHLAARPRLLLAMLAWTALWFVPACAFAQTTDSRGDIMLADTSTTAVEAAASLYRDRADSLLAERTRVAAERAEPRRVLVSLTERKLFVVDGRDTVLAAPVAVGMDSLFEYGGRRWVFATPRGVRTVRGKRADPLWRPPVWAYAEVAREHQLRLKVLRPGQPVTLSDGRQLVVRDSVAGLMLADGFAALPVDEHIVFDSTLFVPPLATRNRRIDAELGRFLLDLGDGYLLHGTPREESIGAAVTHGCVRLRDEDIAWLYAEVPVGARVYIY